MAAPARTALLKNDAACQRLIVRVWRDQHYLERISNVGAVNFEMDIRLPDEKAGELAI